MDNHFCIFDVHVSFRVRVDNNEPRGGDIAGHGALAVKLCTFKGGNGLGPYSLPSGIMYAEPIPPEARSAALGSRPADVVVQTVSDSPRVRVRLPRTSLRRRVRGMLWPKPSLGVQVFATGSWCKLATFSESHRRMRGGYPHGQW